MYKKIIESRLVRVRHIVSFRENVTAYNLMDTLKLVPSKSVITDCSYNEELNSWEIEFLEEQEDLKG